VLSTVFGPEREKVTRRKEKYIMRSFIMLTDHQIFSMGGRDKRRVQNFSWKAWREETAYET
jgi:hypothetical protein